VIAPALAESVLTTRKPMLLFRLSVEQARGLYRRGWVIYPRFMIGFATVGLTVSAAVV
jgi:hypothetical protein